MIGCFLWVRGEIYVNYINEQKALANELLKYKHSSPAPLIDGTIYKAEQSFLSFYSGYYSADLKTTTETRKYLYGFTLDGKLYHGATKIENHYKVADPPKNMFWLPDKGEKIQIIFDPANPAHNMPLKWAERVINRKSSLFVANVVIFIFIIVHTVLIWICYRKWKRQNKKKRPL
ncbi:MAG: hypothetical protein LBU26_01200 [Synergistaceae bacterium]|jgi:hypothetical protein|nr:hypothetical protein [Synergistaceae bacterium]